MSTGRVRSVVLLAAIVLVATGCKGLVWGSDSSNQLGPVSDGSDVTSPTELPEGTWTALEAGASHTCGIKANGTLWCWGNNWYGQVGDPESWLGYSEQVQVGTDDDWDRVSLGRSHTCGIRAGALFCWGVNNEGSVGDGSDDSVVTAPRRVGSASDWTAVSAGDRHSCGIRAGGDLYCWGRGDTGQLGIGSTTDQGVPVAVDGGPWSQVDAGGAHTCAIDSSTGLWCWGSGVDGQLGRQLTSFGNFDTPWAVGVSGTFLGDLAGVPHEGWSTISSGSRHTCGTVDSPAFPYDLDLVCTGDNADGQVGVPLEWCTSDGNTTGDWVGWCWVDLGISASGGRGAVEASATGRHSCAIETTGAMYCWGDNDDGQLGDATTSGATFPAFVGVGWLDVSAGASHTVGRRETG